MSSTSEKINTSVEKVVKTEESFEQIIVLNEALEKSVAVFNAIAKNINHNSLHIEDSILDFASSFEETNATLAQLSETTKFLIDKNDVLDKELDQSNNELFALKNME